MPARDDIHRLRTRPQFAPGNGAHPDLAPATTLILLFFTSLELHFHHVLQTLQPIARTPQLSKLALALDVRDLPRLLLLAPILLQQKLNDSIFVVNYTSGIADNGCSKRSP